MIPDCGFLFVAEAGKPESLCRVSGSRALSVIEIYAQSSNSGTVYVSGPNVLAQNEAGHPLASGQRLFINPRDYGGTQIDLFDVWVDVLTAGDGISWAGWRAG